ncbi:DUF2240 family protein [Halodesulfurarchaeum sp. HSR-GB]|uniref:DUF2240 family protein n=1 Tax=Halodesulfurarchaeum sp. HSR-GB TaxID=3074077 RepID=UPI0028621BA2|nr:DUF2240 family protein [Halodesulfurarchaeum sp. HSR-GB]MDR5655865.1 DUF2240 family protein [Halodesulfurarchaeum sp. HSR-GB]
MSLRVAVAAPFQRAGREQLSEQAFVVDLAVDRNWVSPDQAKTLIELGRKRGLLQSVDEELQATFDPTSVTVPDGFVPDETLFQDRSPIEAIIDTLVASGLDRRETVAAINTLQESLSVTAGTAGVLYARKRGVDVSEIATEVNTELRS